MTAASWQPDPTKRHEQRWWDGTRWTDHVVDHGVAGVDPLAAAPAPTAAASPPATIQMHPTVPAPVPRGRSKVWLVAGALGVAAVVGGLILVTGKDDDKQSAPATEPSDRPSDRTEPTAATTTSAPASTTTTTEAATTTTLRPATTDDLVAALPSPADAPEGWVASGDPPDTAPALGEQPVGFCGGVSSAQRAQETNSVAMVWGPSFDMPNSGSAAIDLYAFANEQDAAAFMAQSAAQASECPDGYQYQVPEGVGEGQYDGFSEGYGDDAVWNVYETASVTPIALADADEAFTILLVSENFTYYDRYDFGTTYTDALQYERHGPVVMVMDLWGACCDYGYGYPTVDYQPTEVEAGDAADWFRPGVVQRLSDQGVL